MPKDLIEVDETRCRRDGVCIESCPVQILAFEDADGFPAVVEGAADFCIRCGHCVAVCPHGALDHRDVPLAQCLPIPADEALTSAQVVRLLRTRRSIRCFQPESLERPTLAGLIDLARYAPSGHNRQPVRWLVVERAPEVQRLAGLVADWMRHTIASNSPLATALHLDFVVNAWEKGQDRICRNAPHLVVAHADREERTAPQAATIALTYLELAAFAHGLGACWAGYFNLAATSWLPLRQALMLPAGHTTQGAMMLGRPRFRYQRVPVRREAEILWR
jgi:nitroreductase/NAD-dependent dihydropyrimidine dehydrogenase PreA subunit